MRCARTAAGPARLAAAGVDFADVNRVLEEEGIQKFAASYRQVLAVGGEKRRRLA